jgi:2-haloacid dehalogenase
MSARWATFDCYGTLVDWQGGMGAALRGVVGERAPEVLERYYEIEPVVQREAFRPYRDVLAIALDRAAAEHGIALDPEQRDVLGRTLPHWPVFRDTGSALTALHARGWKLGILSNIDRDLIEATVPQLGAPIDLVVTAQDVESYKPALAHFEEFARRAGVERSGTWVHVACSLFHDIAPARQIGVPSVWINRDGDPADDRPAATLPDLAELEPVLEALA